MLNKVPQQHSGQPGRQPVHLVRQHLAAGGSLMFDILKPLQRGGVVSRDHHHVVFQRGQGAQRPRLRRKTLQAGTGGRDLEEPGLKNTRGRRRFIHL
ncbi:hypothetical protein EYF80_021265 [Liparis tanakae]|uniref:Uncharacterized protein n=1 Tax=Liparis tanakae TaxID=230148 RepID=A0A4Z2HS65_9TELE|nr:hypothetical protein EYF80_021265 [Liparis tanakae]